MKSEIASRTDVRLNKQLKQFADYNIDKKYADMYKYFSRTAKSPYTEKNKLEIFTSAKDKYDSVLKDIENAKHSEIIAGQERKIVIVHILRKIKDAGRQKNDGRRIVHNHRYFPLIHMSRNNIRTLRITHLWKGIQV